MYYLERRHTHIHPTRSRFDLLVVNHDQAVPRVFPDGSKRVGLERRVLEDGLDVSPGREAVGVKTKRQVISDQRGRSS
jgi:hypothetical protein